MTTSKPSDTKSAGTGQASVTEKASELFQTGVDKVKSNPGVTAAIVGGVAAAAAATVYRDKISETIDGIRSKNDTSDAPSSTSKPTH
jgi:hypothetical protein